MVVTLAVLSAVLLLLVWDRLPADLLMMAALTVLVLTGVLSPSEALTGFANTGVMTVAALYVVVAALRDTGAIDWLARRFLGEPESSRQSLARVVAPASLLSAFLNNTTVVAMMLPAVQDWARRLRLPSSRLLLPLSYATILGGTCTLIGTSTNLVVDGLAQQAGLNGFGLFDLAWVGVPLLLVCAIFLIWAAPRLLPDRGTLLDSLDNVREYRVEMRVTERSALAGKSIRDAGLRSLTHGYLTEVLRDGQLFAAVSPDMALYAGDHLLFVGAPECARELQRISGIAPVNAGFEKLNLRHHQRCLVEVVLGRDFPALGKSIRDGAFRTVYQAAVLSVCRHGERLGGKVGDIVLQAGDSLLLETSHRFVEQYRFRRDFLLVSPLQDSTPPDFRKAPLALAVLVGMVLVNVFGWLSVFESVLLACGLLLVTRCVTPERARLMLSVNLPVLVVIGASFALGNAMVSSGAAQWLVDSLFSGLVSSPWLALIMVYVITTLFTEVITNNAAAVLMFPVGIGAAELFAVSPYPFVVVIMFAASASFMTPLGYQTNLMVMAPGGYRFLDYLRLGLPLSLLAGMVTLALVPLIWPF